jgi:hypothetical protein
MQDTAMVFGMAEQHLERKVHMWFQTLPAVYLLAATWSYSGNRAAICRQENVSCFRLQCLHTLERKINATCWRAARSLQS